MQSDLVEAVARAVTPAVLRYMPDYDEVPPDHVWRRPRYEWLQFAMVQISQAAIAATLDHVERDLSDCDPDALERLRELRG